MGKRKKKFNLISFILDIIFSPLLIVGLGYWYFRDYRKAVFLSLLVTTGYNVLSLIMRFGMLIISSLTFNIFGVIKRLSQIIVTLLIIGFYWGIYIYTWGQNFTL